MLSHRAAVLESGVDSEVPLYVTNLEHVDARFRRLDAEGADAGVREAAEELFIASQSQDASRIIGAAAEMVSACARAGYTR